MIRHLDGFDSFATAQLPALDLWDSFSGVTIASDEGRSGFSGDNAAFFDTALSSVLRKTITVTIHNGIYTVTVGLAIRPVTCETKATICSVTTAISSFDLKMTEWGSLELFQVTGGNPLGLICQTSDGIIPIATGGVYIEIQFKMTRAVSGPIQIRVSDQYGTMNPVAQGTFLNLSAADLPPTQVIMGGGVAEDPATWYLDDVYVTDGVPTITPLNYQGRNILNDSFLGNTHLTTFYMTQDGINQSTGNTPWVPNVGSAVYPVIDEHPPDEDVTYAAADQTDQRSTGLFESPEERPFGRQGCCAFAPLFGIEWLGRLRMDAGSGAVVPVIRRVIGGTFATDVVEVGDTITIDSTDWTYYPQVLERDPTNDNKPYTFAVFFPAGVGVPGTVEFGIQKTD